jgi:nicotinamidase-related amidase
MTVKTLDALSTALVPVDLQRGVVELPIAPHSSGAVVERSRSMATAFRALGAPVVLVRVSFAPDGADALSADVDEPSSASGWSAGWDDLVDSLHVDGDVVVTKRQWGAFYGTDLDLQLRRRGIATIVLGGIATNMGVESTARAAHEHGYDIVFAEDATSARLRSDHTFAFTRIFPRIGRVASTEEILRALGAS